MHRKELEKYLHQLLVEPCPADDLCYNGLQIEGQDDITVVGFAVSVTQEVIEKAIQLQCHALITHHGLFWKRGAVCPVAGTVKKKLELLLQHRLSLFSYHLPLDAHRQYGNNWKAAMDLGWSSPAPFGQYGKIDIGVKGEFAPLPIAQFVAQMERFYAHKAHAVLGGKEEITTAALISGGAHRELKQAVDAGVDCFITGSFDEPIWSLAREEKIHFLALGHYATEVIGPRALAAHFQSKHALKSYFIEETNPF